MDGKDIQIDIVAARKVLAFLNDHDTHGWSVDEVAGGMDMEKSSARSALNYLVSTGMVRRVEQDGVEWHFTRVGPTRVAELQDVMDKLVAEGKVIAEKDAYGETKYRIAPKGEA